MTRALLSTPRAQRPFSPAPERHRASSASPKRESGPSFAQDGIFPSLLKRGSARSRRRIRRIVGVARVVERDPANEVIASGPLDRPCVSVFVASRLCSPGSTFVSRKKQSLRLLHAQTGVLRDVPSRSTFPPSSSLSQSRRRLPASSLRLKRSTSRLHPDLQRSPPTAQKQSEDEKPRIFLIMEVIGCRKGQPAKRSDALRPRTRTAAR